MHVDEETDINKVSIFYSSNGCMIWFNCHFIFALDLQVLDYFSYEHFYVIYCKFFELDADKDSKLFKADLLKYGEHALSEAIVDRY